MMRLKIYIIAIIFSMEVLMYNERSRKRTEFPY